MLLFAYLAAAAAAIAAGLAGPPGFAAYALLKPLTTVLVIVHAARRGRPHQRGRAALLAGLGLSLVGDVALLWPQQGFLPGLVAFLLAHLAYLWAFTREVRFAADWRPFAVYGLVGAAVLALLWPGVPPALRGPVLAYLACLASMAAQAAVVWRAGVRGGGLLALGGGLFLLSDALLATHKFAGPLPLATLWVLATYWAAQWLIASSLPRR